VSAFATCIAFPDVEGFLLFAAVASAFLLLFLDVAATLVLLVLRPLLLDFATCCGSETCLTIVLVFPAILILVTALLFEAA